jgi:RNA polymerase sigma-70 factor, ECF subfamily
MSQPSHDEVALIRRCRDGDQDAIRGLVRLYEGAVFHLLWRATGNEEDARDLAQETFVRAIRALDRFDLARPFRNWIFRIASNLAIDHLRRARLRTVSIDVGEDDESGMHAPLLVDERARPDEVHERTWLSEHLARLVEQLPPEYRTVIHLRHKEQLAYEEIAKILEVPLGTVKARLHRAHHRLRALWKGETVSLDGEWEVPEDE